MARLCTLRQFNFNHFHIILHDIFSKLFSIKTSIGLATAKVSGANLPDQITTMFMVSTDRSFARVVIKTACLGT